MGIVRPRTEGRAFFCKVMVMLWLGVQFVNCVFAMGSPDTFEYVSDQGMAPLIAQ